MERGRESPEGSHVIGAEPEGLAIRGGRLAVSSHCAQARSEGGVLVGVTGLEPDRFAVLGDRLVVLPGYPQENGQGEAAEAVGRDARPSRSAGSTDSDRPGRSRLDNGCHDGRKVSAGCARARSAALR